MALHSSQARAGPNIHSDPILPGAVLGVFGSGQLGRMFALAARRMGYRVHTFSPESDSPTGQVADREVVGDYRDERAVLDFLRQVDVVTFEFENVPALVAETAAELGLPVAPDGAVLHIAQNRVREKTTLAGAGLPVTPFHAIASERDLASAGAGLFPGVLKTAAFGYDGKGQTKVAAAQDLDSAWAALGRGPAILEQQIDFACEVSLIAAANRRGEFAAYPLIENRHARHILDVSIAPARVPDQVGREAARIARRLFDALKVTGVLCIEFFLTRDDRLLINEIAPRPHNSGHLTIEAAVVSQFEQQVRAVCNLPLGETRLRSPAAMANLLGDLWQDGAPDWESALAQPGIALHLYGKQSPRPGRKMGHLTACAPTGEDAATAVCEARGRLAARAGKARG